MRSHLDLGDRVALLMENGPTYPVCSWAARRSGLRAVPVNWHLGPDEAAYSSENSDAKALIVSPRLREVAEAIAARVPALRLLLSDGDSFGDFQSLETALAAYPAEPLAEEPEGAVMFYSSGTTGQPKGILRALSGQYGIAEAGNSRSNPRIPKGFL